MSSDVGQLGERAQVRRHERARDGRLRRLRSKARLRLRLVRDTLCSHRGSPVLRGMDDVQLPEKVGNLGSEK